MNTLDAVYKTYGENTMIAVEQALDIYLSDDKTDWTKALSGATGEEQKTLTTIVMNIAARILRENAIADCDYAIHNSDVSPLQGWTYVRENRVREYADTVDNLSVTILRNRDYNVFAVQVDYGMLPCYFFPTLKAFAQHVIDTKTNYWSTT